MEKFNLSYLIEKDLIEIPETTYQLDSDCLKDYEDRLKGVGGIYIYHFIGEVYYVGISKDVYKRLSEHQGGGRNANRNLKNTFNAGFVLDIEVIVEPSKPLQEIYENILIMKYNPVCNCRKKGEAYNCDNSKGLMGRPKLDTTKKDKALLLYKTGDYTTKEICDIACISKASLFRYVKAEGLSRHSNRSLI